MFSHGFACQAMQTSNKRLKKKNKGREQELLVTLGFANANLQQLRSSLQELQASVQASVRHSMHLRAENTAVRRNTLEQLKEVYYPWLSYHYLFFSLTHILDWLFLH